MVITHVADVVEYNFSAGADDDDAVHCYFHMNEIFSPHHYYDEVVVVKTHGDVAVVLFAAEIRFHSIEIFLLHTVVVVAVDAVVVADAFVDFVVVAAVGAAAVDVSFHCVKSPRVEVHMLYHSSHSH